MDGGSGVGPRWLRGWLRACCAVVAIPGGQRGKNLVANAGDGSTIPLTPKGTRSHEGNARPKSSPCGQWPARRLAGVLHGAYSTSKTSYDSYAGRRLPQSARLWRALSHRAGESSASLKLRTTSCRCTGGLVVAVLALLVAVLVPRAELCHAWGPARDGTWTLASRKQCVGRCWGV